MRRSFIAALALLFASLARAAAIDDGAKAGQEFLLLVDARKYADSWDGASDFLKRSVSKPAWVAQLEESRAPLGDVVARALSDAKVDNDPKGAPPGQYLLLTYETRFVNGTLSKTETLPLYFAPDGRWRVVGYFVR